MSRVLSSAALAALNAQETSQVVVVLLTISHASLPGPICVCSDSRPVTSNGQVFLSVPFALTLPDDREDQIPHATLVIDNCDRTVVAAIRSIGNVPATLKIQIVLASTPDTIEVEYPPLTMRQVVYDALSVSAQLAFEDVLNEGFPGDLVTPATVPGAFVVTEL
jgi:Domain of unknown function (DUF1833)